MKKKTDIAPANPPCPKCGAVRTQCAGKLGLGWALIHAPGCTALAPEPKP